MPRWLTRAIARIRSSACAGQVQFTRKALSVRQLLRLGLNQEDALRILADLSASDFDRRIRSATTGSWLYVFRPTVRDAQLYVRIVLRAGCRVISFHDEGGDEEA